MKHRARFFGVLTGFALVASIATAQTKSAADGIAEYRKLLEDGNPAELFEAKGEGLWKQRRGPKNATLEQCDLGKGPGVVFLGGLGTVFAMRLAARFTVHAALGTALDGALMLAREAA